MDTSSRVSEPSLREKTLGGAAWVGLQNVVTRMVGILQQLALAWLLDKQAFGLMQLAFTVSTFVLLLANPGIDAVLVQRQRRFDRWATPAFWLGITTGIGGMFVMIAAAPIAAWAYGRPQLMGLILVLSLAAPFQTLQIVPKALLQAQLRFRAGAIIATLGTILLAVLTVLFAYWGFGAYSFVIPLPINAAVLSIVTWMTARPDVHWRPRLRFWKYLLGDSSALAGMLLMNTVVNQGDNIMLGLNGVSDAAIGAYGFAFRLSTQAFWLVANSVPTVLFPSLSRLVQDPQAQLRAMMRASRLLAMVAVPFCLLQVLLAGPLFRLFLPVRWQEAVLSLQILSLGIMINAPVWPAPGLMMAQRRFGELFRTSLVYGGVFFAFVAGALVIQPPVPADDQIANYHSIVAVAIAVTLWYYWSSPYAYWVAVRPEHPFYSLFVESRGPLISGAAAAGACAVLLTFLPSGRTGDVAAVAAVTILFTAIYVVVLRWIARRDFDDFHVQLQTVWRGRSRKSTAMPAQAIQSDTRF